MDESPAIVSSPPPIAFANSPAGGIADSGLASSSAGISWRAPLYFNEWPSQRPQTMGPRCRAAAECGRWPSSPVATTTYPLFHQGPIGAANLNQCAGSVAMFCRSAPLKRCVLPCSLPPSLHDHANAKGTGRSPACILIHILDTVANAVRCTIAITGLCASRVVHPRRGSA